MYDTNVSVVVAKGLIISPQGHSIGVINEGERKATSFSVQASMEMTAKNYTITFEIAYDDFRGVTHRETFQTDVTVASNFLMENMVPILIILAIVAICSVVSVYFLRLRKLKQIEAGETKHG